MGYLRFLALASATLVALLSTEADAVTVSVSASASHPIPTTLYGQMYEDISHSGDGGLYAELLQNRAFQLVTPGTSAALASWSATGGGSIAVIKDSAPVSSALPNSLQLTVPSGSNGAVGFSNAGYSGIKVDSTWTYKASFYYKFPAASSFTGPATLTLRSTSGTVFATTTVTLKGSQTTWTQLTATLKPTSSAPSTSNVFGVTVSNAAGQKINFAMFSLFPPTYKDRANGMRVDLATTLASMGPSFFRLPGGNNLEGQNPASRWQWNTTVGPLVNRPGRQGDWGYTNTDGLGLLDYLNWCEDVGMEPIMAVWDGYTLDGNSVAEAGLPPYIQQAIDQINFVIGDPAKSAAAALRSSLGHPAPFTLHYVEVGNEDFFGGTTIQYRWKDFATKLEATFPQLRFIATGTVNSPALTPKPQSWDVHVYQTPSWFASNSFYYDSFARDGTTYFEGEYAAISTNSSDIFGSPATGRLTFSTVQSSVGEAAFMTGLERNSDIVFAASYAPLLGSVTNNQWTPNLVNFDASTVYPSTSFYVQQMFSKARGDAYLPSTLPSPNGTLFWSVTRATAAQNIMIKVVNFAATSNTVTFALPFATVASTGSALVLTGAATASNNPTTPNAAVPKTSTVQTGKTFNYAAPGFSVTVITVNAK